MRSRASSRAEGRGFRVGPRLHEAIEGAVKTLIARRRRRRLPEPLDELRRDELLLAEAIAELDERFPARLIPLLGGLSERDERFLSAVELVRQYFGQVPSHAADFVLVAFDLDETRGVLGDHFPLLETLREFHDALNRLEIVWIRLVGRRSASGARPPGSSR